MYYDFEVPLPDVPGKLAYEKHGGTTYVKYEYDRIYDPEKKFTYPKRATIGKRSKENPDMFRPNQNYLTYFPNAEMPISDYRNTRSSCLRAGAFIVMRKIIKDYKLEEILGMFRECGIDLRSAMTIFVGGGSILLSKIIETVWKRYDGEYYVVNDSKVNVHGYRKKYLFDKEMQ